jgi:Spy/CpxP family protein refolding chaperone
MSTQPRNKILIILIGILLATNIILVSLFLLDRTEKKQERRSPMGQYLAKEVGFTDKQMVQFDTIKAQHRRQVKELFDDIRNRREASFKAIGANGFGDSAILNAATFSASQQQQLEVMMLKHIKDIRNICTPAQQKQFDTGFYKVMTRPRNDDKKDKDK